MHSTTSTSGSCVTNIWFIGLAAWLTATWAILCAVGFAAVGSATIPTYSYDYRTTSIPVLLPQNIELTAYMFSFCITNPPEYGYSYNPSTPSRNSYGQIGPSITVCYPFSAENKDFFTTQASIVDGATFNGGKTSHVQYSEIQAAQAFYIMAIVTLSVSVVLAWLLAFTPQSRPTKMTGVVLSGLCVFTFLCVIISLGTATHVFTQAKSQFDGYPSTSPYIYQGGTTQPPIKTSASVTVSAALPLLGIMILFSLLSTTLSVFVAIIKPRQPGVGVQRI